MPKKTIKAVPVKAVTNNEFIRIAPLHHPKTKVNLEELGQNSEDTALLQTPLPKAPPPPKLIYHHGPLITNVKVYTIFWGKNWKSIPAFVNLEKSINTFFKDILVSPLIDQLAEYNTPVYKIG